MTDLDTSDRDDTGATGVAAAPASPDKDRLGASYYKLFTGTVVSNLGDGIGTVAYPWLASAITRNPILVALVAVAQRLPWLVFTLPAGVITDRVDRRKAMMWMDVLRGVLTVGVAFAVLGSQGGLPGPDEVDTVVGTRWGLLTMVLVATLLLGMAEVLRDNANQTIIPNIVRSDQLEKANGRIWGVEAVTNTFAGPPLGSVLLIVAFSLPFFVDAATFFVAAAMVALIPGTFRAQRDPNRPRQTFRQELGEGVHWLMAHPLLRPMAIILGLMNGAGMIAFATFVLFAQEVMEVGPFLFTVIGFGGAIGGLLGGNVAPWVTRRVGSGTALAISIGGLAVVPFLVGAIAWWPAVLVLFGFEAFFGILWNVITVSLRQAIIPEGLLGRVNSVYRFFAWGMIPIGSAIGGVWVWVMERQVDREFALRSTWFLVGAIHVALFLFGRAKLTTDKIEAARAAATTPSAS
ncbi:MAG TPA: MFS transporter [Ilumatobacter sp.]|nr:MFS transporter [Ilumatobacter sp.]